MPPRLYLFSGSQSLAIRTSQKVTTKSPAHQHIRYITAKEKPLPENADPQAKGPNQDQLPHVSEEAGAMGNITGEGGPDLDQATPVQEILDRDKDAQEKAPEVLKKDPSKPQSQYTPTGTRSYSTSAIRRATDFTNSSSSLAELSPPHLDPATLQNMLSVASADKGIKFEMPDKRMVRTDHLKHRYDPVVNQVTKLMMRDGKLATAQKELTIALDLKNMDIILNHLRTAPPPKPSPNVFPILQSYYNPPVTGYIPSHSPKDFQRKLAAGGNKATTPTPAQLNPSLLPLDPVTYLTLAIDSVAPLVKVRQQRGVLGGGQSLQIPVPLPLKQRRRTAISWILAASDRRKEVNLADRVAREIINVVEGRSGAWQRREGVHKLGIGARSNVRFGTQQKRR